MLTKQQVWPKLAQASGLIVLRRGGRRRRRSAMIKPSGKGSGVGLFVCWLVLAQLASIFSHILILTVSADAGGDGRSGSRFTIVNDQHNARIGRNGLKLVTELATTPNSTSQLDANQAPKQQQQPQQQQQSHQSADHNQHQNQSRPNKTITTTMGQVSIREPLLSLASSMVPQFDDEPDQALGGDTGYTGGGSSSLGLADTTYTLQPSSGPAPRFNWLEETTAATGTGDGPHHYLRQYGGTSHANSSMVARAKLLGDPQAKYQTHLERTLDSIRPRSLRPPPMVPAQLTIGATANDSSRDNQSNRPIRRFVGENNDGSASVSLFDLRTGPIWNEGKHKDKMAEQKWRQNKKFLKLVQQQQEQQQQGHYPHGVFKQSNNILVRGDVSVRSDVVLVKDQAINRSDSSSSPFGSPIKTLSGKVEVEDSSDQYHSQRRLQARRPGVAPSELLIVGTSNDFYGNGTGSNGSRAGINNNNNEGAFMIINKDDIGIAQEAGINSVEQLMLTRPVSSSPAAGSGQSHRLTVSLSDLLQRQAESMKPTGDESVGDSVPLTTTSRSVGPTEEEEMAAKRTSEEDDESGSGYESSSSSLVMKQPLANEHDDEQLSPAGSSNSLGGMRKVLVAQPARLMTTPKRNNSTREKLPLEGGSSLDIINRKLGLASLDIGSSGGGNKQRPHQQQLNNNKKQQQLKSASASTSEIRVTIGDPARPVFINSRGLITAAKNRHNNSSSTSTRPLYNPSKLFASSQGSYTLDPLEPTRSIIKTQTTTQTKDKFNPMGSRPTTVDHTHQHHKSKNKHGSGATVAGSSSSSLSPSKNKPTSNKISSSLMVVRPRPDTAGVTLEPLESTLASFDVSAPSSSLSFDQSNQLVHNWTNGGAGIQFGQAPMAKRNNSKIGYASGNNNSNRVSLGGPSEEAPIPASGGTKQTGASSLGAALISSLLDHTTEQTTKHSWPFEGATGSSYEPTRTTTTASSSHSLLDDEQEQQQQELDNDLHQFNYTSKPSSFLSSPFTSNHQPMTTTLASNFNHNPPYKHHSSVEPVTAPSVFNFNNTSSSTMTDKDSNKDFVPSSSSPAASSFQHGTGTHNRNSTRPNNRFNTTSHHTGNGNGGHSSSSGNNNKSAHYRPPPHKVDASQGSTNTTFSSQSGHNRNTTHSNNNKRPPTSESHHNSNPPYESTTSLSSLNLGEPANTLHGQHLNNHSSLAGAHSHGAHVQASGATNNGTKPNKIRVHLHNLLLNKFLIKPIQQQAQAAAAAAAAAGQQTGSSGSGGSSVGSNGVSPAPLLSNTVANNVAHLLAQKLTSLVRPGQQQHGQQQTQQQQQQSQLQQQLNPFNSLFGFRVKGSSPSYVSSSSSSSQATSPSPGSAFTKLKQRVSAPFAAQAHAGPSLIHRRTAGVGSLLFSGLIYGLTVLPALMALTGINPLSTAASETSETIASSLAGAAGSSSSLAANRHGGDRTRARQKIRQRPASGSSGDDLSDSFAYLIPLLSSAATTLSNSHESASSDAQHPAGSLLTGGLGGGGGAGSGISAHLGDEPQSSALQALYAPPPTILEPVGEAPLRGGSDISSGGSLNSIGMLDEAQELDWAAYSGRPSGQSSLRNNNKYHHHHQPSYQLHHHNGRHQTFELPASSITEHYSSSAPERAELGPLRLVTATRHHRDLTPTGNRGNRGSGGGNDEDSYWHPSASVPERKQPPTYLSRGLSDQGRLASSAAAGGGAQQSMGSVLFEQPNNGLRGDDAQPIRWNQQQQQQQQLNQLQELKQQLQKDQQRFQQQLASATGHADSQFQQQQQQNGFALAPPVGPSLIQAGEQAAHDSAQNGIHGGRSNSSTQQQQNQDDYQTQRQQQQQQNVVDSMRWNVGIGGNTGYLQDRPGSAQNDPIQQVNSPIRTTPQQQSRPSSSSSSSSQSVVQLGDDLAILGQYKPQAMMRPGETNSGAGQSPMAIEFGEGGQRHRRTIVNHNNQLQLQPQQPGGGDGSLGDAPLSVLTANNQRGSHEHRALLPVSHKGSFSSELDALNRDQLQTSLIGAIDQGRQMLNLKATQSMFLPQQQQNKLIQGSSGSSNNDDYSPQADDKLNRLRDFPRADPTNSPGDHLNPQTPRWSSASEWRAIGPLPTTTPLPRALYRNNQVLHQSSGGATSNNLDTPIIRYNTRQQGAHVDLLTRGDIETVIGRKYHYLADEHKSPSTTTKRPRGKKKPAGSKKGRPNENYLKSLTNKNKSKQPSSKVAAVTTTTTTSTTRAPPQSLLDAGESELILAHSMAMGSRVLNDPIDGRHHD